MSRRANLHSPSILSLITLLSGVQIQASDARDFFNSAGASDSTIFTGVMLLDSAPLRHAPNPSSRAVAEIPKAMALEVFPENFGGYLMVRYEGKIGYVHYLEFDRHSIPGPLSRVFNTERNDAQTSALQQKFGRATTSRIMRREIWRGMTAAMVRESIGRPTQLERITERGLTREEWTYGDGRMLVLKSGKVSLIHDVE